MSYRYERRRRRGPGCLGCSVLLIWLGVALVAGYLFWLRPQLSRMVGEQVARQIAEAPADAPDSAGAPGELSMPPGALPTAVAALPSGELRLSEQEVNAYLAANAEALRPVEQAAVRFTPGVVEADVAALGLRGTARLGLAAEGGRIVAVEPQLDGALGQFIALEELVRPLEQQLNDQLAAQGRRVSGVRVEQGELVVTVEG